MFAPTTLTDRDEHQGRLRTLLGDAVAGSGHTVLITGPVASGKTALISTLAEPAGEAGALLLETSCPASAERLGFGLLHRLLHSTTTASDVFAESRLLLEIAVTAAAEERPALVAELAAALARVATERPLVLIVDDMHHADEPSAQVLLDLGRRIRRARVLLVLTERAGPARDRGGLHAQLSHEPHFRRLRLDLLSPEATAGLLTEHVTAEVAVRLAAETHASTGGNPLLVRAVIADTTDQPVNGEPTLIRAESYRRAVLTCLHRHGPATVAVARGLAVLGSSAGDALVGELLDRHPREVLDQVAELRQAGLVDGWRFRDEAAQAAVLEAVPPGDLITLHRRAAELLRATAAAPLELARHVLGGDVEPAAWMGPAMRQAAGHALAEGRPELARRCLEAALRVTPDEKTRAGVRMRLIRLLWRTAPAAAAERLDELADDARENRLGGPEVVQTIAYLAWAGRLERAAGLVCELAEAGTVTADALASAARWLGVFCPPMRPRLDPLGLSPTGPLTADGTAGAPDDPYLHAAHAVTTALATGSSAEAVLVLQRYHLNDSTAQPVLLAVQALLFAGQFDLATAWANRLIDEAARRQAPAWQAMFTAAKAEIMLRRGELTQALPLARAALTLLPVPSWGTALAFPAATLIEVCTAAGLPDEALGVLALPAPQAMTQTLGGVRHLRARGLWRLATGRSHAALGDFMACGEFQERWGLDSPALAPWRLDAGEAWLALGDTERAASLANRQLRRLRPGADALRAAALGVLGSTGDPHSRLQALGEAVEILERGGDRVRLALVLGELGRAYRELGNFPRGRTLTGKAWYVAKACGALPLTETLMPQYTDAETPAVLEQPEGGETLTEAEMRVAVLAAHGHTNREISAKLFITISTVEQHMTRIYRKLNVKRRRDLPLSLAGPESTRLHADSAG
ncbi:helix-turn-helix transcriptional regulator [Actinoplanes regularis]|uniref:helix-turn-helix transcriptional regulator n=1 Tax=Actinoplanes regularis TaxID=52697 RepID=UPI0024A3B1B4|nr:LuxR family transcriptional regulator [Actinoplanes regularis]GLW33352.1 transcriptional regulator [Actinoplanes regularis]